MARVAYTELECLTNERKGCYTDKGHQLSADVAYYIIEKGYGQKIF